MDGLNSHGLETDQLGLGLSTAAHIEDLTLFFNLSEWEVDEYRQAPIGTGLNPKEGRVVRSRRVYPPCPSCAGTPGSLFTSRLESMMMMMTSA
jgi:hypothetical protein